MFAVSHLQITALISDRIQVLCINTLRIKNSFQLPLMCTPDVNLWETRDQRSCWGNCTAVKERKKLGKLCVNCNQCHFNEK